MCKRKRERVGVWRGGERVEARSIFATISQSPIAYEMSFCLHCLSLNFRSSGVKLDLTCVSLLKVAGERQTILPPKQSTLTPLRTPCPLQLAKSRCF